MYKNATKCNKSQSKWCINKHGAAKIIDTFETYQSSAVHEEENIIQDTPEAALVVANAYMLTMQPEPGDPHESMHFAGIKSLGLFRDELKQNSLEKEIARHEQRGKRSRRSQSPQT
jgi:hypothetical protein